MSFKKVELNQLRGVTDVVRQQVTAVREYLNTVDNLEQIPVVSDAVSVQEVMHSTASLLAVSNALLTQQLAETFASNGMATYGMNSYPGTITLNVQDLDDSYEEEDVELEDLEDDEEDEDNTQTSG